MKNKNYFLFLIILAIYGQTIKGQDIHFSQLSETPLFLSPSNAGFFNGYTRAIANYRNQWASMGNAYQTFGLSVDGGLFKTKKHTAFMGYGFTMYRDQAGAAKLSRTNFMVNVSGIVKLGNHSALSVGLAGGTIGTNGNFSGITYESQFNGNTLDPSLNSGETPYNKFVTTDASIGSTYEYSKFKRDPDHDDGLTIKVFAAAHHINKPTQQFGISSSSRLPVRFVYGIMSVYDVVDTRFTLTPTFVYISQGSANELFFGSYLKYRLKTGTKVTGVKTQDAIGFGLYYRVKDAIVPKLIADLGDYSVALSYDVNFSGYTTASRGFGGFEIALRYNNLASSLFHARKEFR